LTNARRGGNSFCRRGRLMGFTKDSQPLAVPDWQI
jgi:hypothetical protein